MNLWNIPWIELAVLVPLLGAIRCLPIRQASRSFAWGVVCTCAALVCSAMAWLGNSLNEPDCTLFGWRVLAVDGLSGWLASMTALLFFLTTLATGRTKILRFSVTWSLMAEAILIAAFSSIDPWMLIGLLAAGTLPPYLVLKRRGRPTRVFVIHMALFVGLLVLGWGVYSLQHGSESVSTLATLLLLAAVLLRCGTVPAHCWITDWFEHASFGNALLFVAPLTGVYAAIRLVLPIAPDWALKSIGIISLITAMYAAGLATVQNQPRRFFAYLFVSQASLVLVGLELHTTIALTGALSMWISVTLGLGGLGLTLRALEARFGELSMQRFHGLYEHSPALAVCFLLTGLASVGFPGTFGFVALEMLVDGAVGTHIFLGVAVIVAGALNGIAVVRAYLMLFTGAKHSSTISLAIIPRERIAVLTLALLILVGGLFPQPGVASRHEVAEAVLNERSKRFPTEENESAMESVFLNRQEHHAKEVPVVPPIGEMR